MPQEGLPVLRDWIVLLVAMGLIAPLVRRLNAPSVLGYLLAGVLIGPYGLGALAEYWPWLAWATIKNVKTVHAMAELGVVFLLFMVGLELSWERLMSMARLVFGLGAAQVILTAAILAALLRAATGLELAAASVVGMALAMSSTAIVMHMMVEERRLATPVGRAAFAVLLFQDLAVVPMLFLTGALAADAGGILWPLFLNLGKAALAIGIITLLGRLLLRPMLRFAAKSRESFMAVTLLLVVGTGVITHAAGLSMALGAFLAGLLLAETEYSHQVQVDLEPFKGLLMGVFFTSIGMNLDLPAALGQAHVLLLVVMLLVLVKAAVLLILARLFGLSAGTGIELALLLAHGGEFAFVVLSQAAGREVVPWNQAQFFMVVTTVSMFMLGFLARLGRRLGMRLSRAEVQHRAPLPTPEETRELKDHVIIIGYGRVGQLLGEILNDLRQPFVAIDNDPVIVAAARETAPVYFGNATHPDILRRLGAGKALALVITMDDAETAERVVRMVSRHWPQLPVLARARDTRHAMRLVSQGAHEVVPETVEASLDLAELLLQSTGLGAEAAHDVIAARREQERQRLLRAVERGRRNHDAALQANGGAPGGNAEA